MGDTINQSVDTTKARYFKSYQARRTYKGDIQFPPEVPGVRDAVDIHCFCPTLNRG